MEFAVQIAMNEPTISDEASGEPVRLRIELLDPEATYELNDFINGILSLELNRPLPARCITVKLKCIGEARWRLLPADSQPDRSLKERHVFLNTDYSIEKSRNSFFFSSHQKSGRCPDEAKSWVSFDKASR